MSKNIKQRPGSVREGFTIIEVVLVLAVAGLIFLMVFIALPSLQRSQRDTQRRNDYAMLVSNVISYMSNNGGKLTNLSANSVNASGSGSNAVAASCPSLSADKYINSSGEAPDGMPYALYACTYTAWNGLADRLKYPGSTDESTVDIGGKTTKNIVYVVTGANCGATASDGMTVPASSSSNKAFAVYGYLESGTYCQANDQSNNSTTN